MHALNPALLDRRAFLRRGGQLALAGTALPLALSLAALGEAAAMTATDYKALVCVFLFGGNDYANTVVTYDEPSHAAYSRARSGSNGGASIVLAREALQASVLRPTQALAGGRQYALHPSMTALAGLFNSGQAAVQLNVGPLVGPTTRAQFEARSVPLPPKLFSHNDQQSIWQANEAEGAAAGWGGRMGDLALSANGQSLFTCISVAGNAVFLAGDQALQYQCSTAGPIAVRPASNQFFYQPAQRALFVELLQQAQQHVLAEEYTKVMRRGMAAETRVRAALAEVATPFPADNPLAAQLRIVARLIGGRAALGVKRQVFFVSLGGFDLHDAMAARQPGQLRQVSEAMAAFHAATQALGVAEQVCAFTASDFGRTLSSNGDGTDHGWGGHQLLVGGAVRGQAFYGQAPAVSVGDSGAPQDQGHVGRGRLLPSTAVDQFAATLARWFGVSATEQRDILPNLGAFGGSDYPLDLGFMRA
ncbi:MAG: DUF1501 domain-containing protein [Rubrivivax sp.]|nr:DUF1501 domain-containing protein [Rubrivivax sp.]